MELNKITHARLEQIKLLKKPGDVFQTFGGQHFVIAEIGMLTVASRDQIARQLKAWGISFVDALPVHPNMVPFVFQFKFKFVK